VRFEGDQVVCCQVVQAVRQADHHSPGTAPDNDHVKELLLHRQVALHVHAEWRVREEVGKQQAKEAVPVAQRSLFAGHRTLSSHCHSNLVLAVAPAHAFRYDMATLGFVGTSGLTNG